VRDLLEAVRTLSSGIFLGLYLDPNREKEFQDLEPSTQFMMMELFRRDRVYGDYDRNVKPDFRSRLSDYGIQCEDVLWVSPKMSWKDEEGDSPDYYFRPERLVLKNAVVKDVRLFLKEAGANPNDPEVQKALNDRRSPVSISFSTRGYACVPPTIGGADLTEFIQGVVEELLGTLQDEYGDMIANNDVADILVDGDTWKQYARQVGLKAA
jgi:hypothetical protein